MKLRLSESEEEEEEERPTSLSLDFFTSLMAAEAKRFGAFQILSFTKKRDRVYSTKLNDGFFILKVMMLNEAADQLEKGLIQPLYLLKGGVRNHGEGVIVIKDEVKFWRCQKEVGQAVAWRLKKPNINFKGSNFVVWSTQKIQSLHSNASQIMIDYGIQLVEGKDQTDGPSLTRPSGKSNSKRKSAQRRDNTFSPPNNQATTEQDNAGNQLKQLSQAETKSIPTEEVDPATPIKQDNTERFRSILELIMTDSSSDKGEPAPQPRLSTNRKKLMERREDLQFIFNCLSDSQSEGKQKKVKVPDNILNSSSEKNSSSNDDYDLSEFISKRIKVTQSFPQQRKSLCKSEVKKQAAKQSTQMKQVTSFEDLYHGFVNNSSNWQSNVLIKCKQQVGGITYCILSDQRHQYLILAYFVNPNRLCFDLTQSCMYLVGKGVIKHPITHKSNCSAIDIEFNCQNSLINPIQHSCIEQIIQPSSNYTPIANIYQTQEGILINCFGVLKSCKCFKGKSGNTLHYEIVDPITRWSIIYVQFDSPSSLEDVKEHVDRPLTIFCAVTGAYKAKKNIVRKPFTIIKHDWLPLTKEAREIQIWIKEGNSVTNIDTELVGYSYVTDLRDIEEEDEGNFVVASVLILEFKNKYTYRACSKCFKKVDQNRCRTCGVRKMGQIQERLFLRGEIGDDAATLNVIWSNSIAENMISGGFSEMSRLWLLKRVTIWIDKGSNGSLSIVRMRLRNISEDLPVALSEIRQNILLGQ